MNSTPKLKKGKKIIIITFSTRITETEVITVETDK